MANKKECKEQIIAVVVTTNRPDELNVLLQRISTQTLELEAILVVDTGDNPRTGEILARYPLAEHVPSKANLGGAGGFAFGMILALSRGAEWVWVMDDDGYPEKDDCLARLLAVADRQNLDAISPLVIDPVDPARLAFPHRSKGRYCYERNKIEQVSIINNFVHLFNGALFRNSVFFRVGLPDMRLFIRGDESDFMFRMKRAKIRFATVTGVGYVHPSGWSETVPLVDGCFHAVIPPMGMKRYCFFRNRGYIFRRYGLYHYFVYDMLRYPVYFLLMNKFNWRGMRFFFRALKDGFMGRFNYPPC